VPSEVTQKSTTPAPQRRPLPKEGYSEPLLIKHEGLRDITGQKYGEKSDVEKDGAEV
jgi:hypothetical protein